MRRAVPIIISLLPIVGTSGCSWTDGTTRTSLVFGIGVVKTAERREGPVRVQETVAVGAMAIETPGLRGVFVGGASVSRLDIEKDADVLVERWVSRGGRALIRVRPVCELPEGEQE